MVQCVRHTNFLLSISSQGLTYGYTRLLILSLYATALLSYFTLLQVFAVVVVAGLTGLEPTILAPVLGLPFSTSKASSCG